MFPGLTALITVDHYCCLYCWRIPNFTYTNWFNATGSMRLYIESSEVVQLSTLSAHFQSRYYRIISLYHFSVT